VVVTFTPEDALFIGEAAPSTRVVQIPLGIDLPRDPSDPVGASPPTIAFIGGSTHPPNADAAMRLMHAIMPPVRRQRPGLKLMLVGDQPTSTMLRTASPDDEITGPVPSVAPYLD